MIDHSNTICSNCGSNYTGGSWLRTCDKDGSWGGKYHCNMCHTYFNPNTGKFFKNPRVDKRIDKHENTKCIKCGSDKTSNNWHKLYDENNKWDHKSYICKKCYDKYSPNSTNNIMKSMRKFRNGELDPDSTTGKGFRVVQCVAKVLGIEDCNIKLDNFNIRIDLCHEEYGEIEVRGSSFYLVGGYWKIGDISYKTFDTFYIVCMGSNFENVKIVYRMSKKDIGDINSIIIYKNPLRNSKYEKFRIDEKPYQEAFKSMSIDNCKYLRKSDINE